MSCERGVRIRVKEEQSFLVSTATSDNSIIFGREKDTKVRGWDETGFWGKGRAKVLPPTFYRGVSGVVMGRRNRSTGAGRGGPGLRLSVLERFPSPSSS